jgi:hypothetical protein
VLASMTVTAWQVSNLRTTATDIVADQQIPVVWDVTPADLDVECAITFVSLSQNAPPLPVMRDFAPIESATITAPETGELQAVCRDPGFAIQDALRSGTVEVVPVVRSVEDGVSAPSGGPRSVSTTIVVDGADTCELTHDGGSTRVRRSVQDLQQFVVTLSSSDLPSNSISSFSISCFSSASPAAATPVAVDLVVRNGDITNQSAAAELNGADYLLGDLVLVNSSGFPNEEIDVSSLKAIAGAFLVHCSGSSAITTVSFSALRLVASSFTISECNGGISVGGELTLSLNFSSLAHVGGSLNLTQNDNHRSLFFPSLTAVGANLNVNNNANLISFRLPVLTRVDGDFNVQSNDNLNCSSDPNLRDDVLDARCQLSIAPTRTRILANAGGCVGTFDEATHCVGHR